MILHGNAAVTGKQHHKIKRIGQIGTLSGSINPLSAGI